MASPRNTSGLQDVQAALGAPPASVSAPPATDPRSRAADPYVMSVGAPPRGERVFGTNLSREETEALAGDLPMRQATVKKKVIDPDTQEEDFEDEVQYGVDMRELRNRLTRALVTQELNRRQGVNPEYVATPEERQALTKSLRTEAQRRLIEKIQRANNENFLFIDDDPEGDLDELQRTGGLPESVANVIRALPDFPERELLGTAGPVGAWLANVIRALPDFHERELLGTAGLVGAWLHGRGGRTYQPVYDEATGKWHVAEEELAKREGVLGALEFVGQPAPSTYVATAIAAGYDREAKGEANLSDIPLVRTIFAYAAGRQTPEQIARVRAGEDMFTFAGEIGAAVTPFEDDPESLLATVVGAGASFGVALVEPDLVSVATFGLGKVARAGSAVQKTGKVLGKVLPMADKWSEAGRLARVSQESAVWAERLSSLVASGADPEDIAGLERQAAKAIHNLNPHLNFMLQSRLRALTAMGENGDARVNNALLYALSVRKLGATSAEDAKVGTLESYLRRRDAVLAAEDKATELEKVYEQTLSANPAWAKDFETLAKQKRELRWELSLFDAARGRSEGDREALAAVLNDAPDLATKDKITAVLQMDSKTRGHAMAKTRRAYKKVQARMGTVLKNAGDDFVLAATSAEKKAAKAALSVDIRRSAAEHYADAAVLAHMTTMRKALDKVTQRRPAMVEGAEAAKKLQEYQQAIGAYAKAQRGIILAKTEGELQDAQNALYNAGTALRKVTLTGADHIAAKGFQALDDAIETAAKRAGDSKERLDFWVEVAQGAKLKPDLGNVERALKSLKSVEFQATRERIVARAYADSLRHISEQYGNLAAKVGAGETPGNINLTKAMKAVRSALDAQGVADTKGLLAVTEDVFGAKAVDQFLAAEKMPERLRGYATALRAARAGDDGAIQLDPTTLGDFVTSMKAMKNAAFLEGTETAVATELRRITQAGLDELVGPDLIPDVEVMERLSPKLVSATREAGLDPAQGIPGGVLRRALEEVVGPDVLARAEASDKAVDMLGDVLKAQGVVPVGRVMDVVASLNRFRREAAEFTALQKVGRALVIPMRKTWRMLQRTALTVTNPAAAKMGLLFDNDNLLQIGKGVIDHSKVIQREIVEIASSAVNPLERAERMRQYITDPMSTFPGYKAVGHAALGNKSLWDGAALLWKGMTKKEAASDDLLRALSRIWVKDGTVMPAKGDKALMKAAMEAFQKAKVEVTPDGAQRLNMSFTDFSELMLRETVRLEQKFALAGRLVRHRQGEEVRAMGYAAQLVGAAASIQRASDSMALRMVGVSEETVHNVRRFLENNETAINEGFDETYKLFARMGIPPKDIEQAEAIGKKFQRGVLAIRDSDGNLGAFPYEWHHHIVKEVEPLMKRWMEVSDATRDTLPVRVWEFMRTMMRIWRTSVTSGVLVISPRYLATNSFGLISQIGMEHKFSTAFKAIANGAGAAAMESWPVQTLGRILPGSLGRALDEPYLRALAANSGSTRGTLGTIANAIYNPCVAAVYDTARFGDAVTLPSANGIPITMGQLRKGLVEQGVLTSQASENMMEIMSRASRLSNESRKWTLPWLAAETARGYREGGVLGGLKAPAVATAKFWSAPVKHLDERGQVIAGLADAVEQRQRVVLYTDLVVNQGLHEADAGRIVREAAYDWNHAGTENEAKLLGPLVMFYRAIKLMYRQGVRHAMDPFLRGFRGDGMRVVGGSIAKLRGLEGTTEAAGDYYQSAMYDMLDYERDVLPFKDADPAEYDRLLADWQFQQTSPWWMAGGNRGWLGSSVLSEEQRAGALESRGKKATHLATTMPSHTVLEFVGHVYGSAMGLAALATGQASPDDLLRRAGSGLAEMGGPVGGEGIQAAVDAFLGTDAGAYRGDPNRLVALRGPEQILAEHFPDLLHAEYDPEDKQWKVPSHVAARLRLTPVLGTELINYAVPAADIASGLVPVEDSAIAYYMRQVTGLGRTYPFDPLKEQENKSKYSIEAEVKEAEKIAGGKEYIGAQMGDVKPPKGLRRASPVDRIKARKQRIIEKRKAILRHGMIGSE